MIQSKPTRPLFFLLLLLLAACGTNQQPLPTPFSTAVPIQPTPTSTFQTEPILTAEPTPPQPTIPAGSSTADPFTIDLPLSIPTALADSVWQLTSSGNGRFSLAADPNQAQIRLGVNQGTAVSRWLYVIAAPFATYSEQTTLAEVQAAWSGTPSPLGMLIVGQDVLETFSVIWGPPAAGVTAVIPADLNNALWSNRPSWTILPFNRLTPDLKLIPLDGRSPLTHEFDQITYPLVVTIGVAGEETAVAAFRAAWNGPPANRDPSLLTRVAMSGVTALGRATAYQMELQGVTTPGLVVGPVLQAADIAHISHEVPFAPDCPYPNPVGDPVFCADDRYLELLQFVGTDVVELTGNHVNDWGADNLLHTIELYEAAGMKTFGGGRNLASAQEPALFEHNGNKIAFAGCNPVGPAGAWATADRAGSLPCDFPALYEQIGRLRDEGYFVIATQQYQEFYQYPATVQQEADFRLLADAGAAAVSGSQGHHAQGFDFHNGAFIHYGLGNLFFDQMQSLGLRQSFIDTYVIYDGRLLSVELFTTLIEDFCCPRLMTAEEREQVLTAVFQASGW
jgi:poly-gamma-glutamate synthesis protein (capsule biosynthesis protein)